MWALFPCCVRATMAVAYIGDAFCPILVFSSLAACALDAVVVPAFLSPCTSSVYAPAHVEHANAIRQMKASITPAAGLLKVGRAFLPHSCYAIAAGALVHPAFVLFQVVAPMTGLASSETVDGAMRARASGSCAMVA